MSNEVRIPDIEVIVGASGDDLAVFCFYRRDDIHQGYDMACALSNALPRAVLRQILFDAIQALDRADWYAMDELDALAPAEGDEPPF